MERMGIGAAEEAIRVLEGQLPVLRVNQDGKRDNQDGKFLKGLFSEVLAPI
jgi:hypothetical protein